METVSVIRSQVRKLNIVICDDESEQIENMIRILNMIESDIEFCIDSFTSAKELLNTLEQQGKRMPDIIFSDIQMPEVDGITFGKLLHKIAPESFLVFTTAYAEYAIQGYEARAFRYLLKPILRENIDEIIQKVLVEMSIRYKLLIREGEEYIIPLKDVLYLSAEDKYTVIYTDKGYHVTRISLAEYEKMLDRYGFYRIHRKYIVNTFHHLAMGNGKITLSNGKGLPISRRKKDLYYEHIMKRLEKELIK